MTPLMTKDTCSGDGRLPKTVRQRGMERPLFWCRLDHRGSGVAACFSGSACGHPSNPAAGENEGSEHPVLRPCSLSTMGRQASFNQSLRANFRHPEKTNPRHPRHPRHPSNKPNKLKARTRKTNPENTFPLCFAALRLLFPNPENRFVPDFVPDLPGFLRGPVRPQPHILP
jgi:hypothetical protein